MKKIIIIGNSGSGKTWLGKRAATVLGIPHIALDSIFWEPGGYNRKRNQSEVEADLKRIQNSECWIAEGVFGHLVDQLFFLADTLIYLDLPWPECSRSLFNRGSESSRQLDPKKAEENFQALLEWASEYETRDSKASKNYHCFLFESFPREKKKVCSRIKIDQLLEKLTY
jgi:adenylate kinase family enzyme